MLLAERGKGKYKKCQPVVNGTVMATETCDSLVTVPFIVDSWYTETIIVRTGN